MIQVIIYKQVDSLTTLDELKAVQLPVLEALV